MLQDKKFKPGDLIHHKFKTELPLCLVIGNYNHEIPSKMPPRYERRVLILSIEKEKIKFDSAKELDLMIGWQLVI